MAKIDAQSLAHKGFKIAKIEAQSHGSAWVPGGPLLQHRACLSFWTEHSERNWLVSILAALGVPREKCDYRGRWRAISASDEYSRTAQFLVYHRKKKLCEG